MAETYKQEWLKTPNQFGGKRQSSLAENANLSIQRTQQENTTREIPVAALPVGKKPKHTPEEVALFDELAAAFYEHGDKWAPKGAAAEATMLYDLIAWSRVQDPEHWQDWARNVVVTAWKLKEGTAAGQAYKDREFWGPTARLGEPIPRAAGIGGGNPGPTA